MLSHIRFAIGLVTLGLFLPLSAPGDDTADQALDFQEVYELLKAQLADFDETTMGDAAARGLIEKLRPRVQLIQNEAPLASQDLVPPIAHSRIYKDAFAYVRLEHLSGDAAEAFKSIWKEMNETNRLKGLILDLRFTEGTDYNDATRLADLFFSQPQLLADWGDGEKRSTVSTNAINLPTAILINDQTAGAAEVLAAILRHGTRALVLGSRTAGEASTFREFQLTTGQQLRVAVQPVKVGAEGEIGEEGLAPDIRVESDPDHERIWLEDPYFRPSAPETADGSSPRRRLNEADLVRMLREGELPEDLGERGGIPAPATGPLIQDPVLARAVDFLKGLALVRQFNANRN